jgi:hypothetical protein
VAAEATKRVGRSFRPGQTSQCANFVRDVFQATGITLPVVSRPTDLHLLGPGVALGPGYANSLAGPEVGPLIPPAQARPGDIVLYANTIPGYAPGVITHVAICAGNGRIIHRPTSDKPVCEEDMRYARIAEIRRPKALGGAGTPAAGGDVRVKIFFHDGRMQAYKDGRPVAHLSVRIEAGGRLSVAVDGKPLTAKALRLEVVE